MDWKSVAIEVAGSVGIAAAGAWLGVRAAYAIRTGYLAGQKLEREKIFAETDEYFRQLRRNRFDW